MSITRCPHCGTANRAGSNFCNGCGTDLRNPDAQPDPHPDTNAPQPDTGAEDARSATPPPASEPPGEAMPPARSGRTPATGRPQPPKSEPLAPPPAAAPSGNQGFFADQPWLRLEFDATDEPDQSVTDLDEDATLGGDARLITSVQGLLAPIRITTNIPTSASTDTGGEGGAPSLIPVRPGDSLPAPDELAADEIRLMRGLLAEPPTLVSYLPRPTLHPIRSLRIPWIFALLGLAIGLPALLLLAEPRGTPHAWPGVPEAYLTLQNVAPGSLVIVYWAYDPSTAGELDLAMQPVMRHLLERRVRVAVVTQQPGGIASAERLLAQVRAESRPGNLAQATNLAQPVTFAFLPGGPATLPLLAREPTQVLLENPTITSEDARDTFAGEPALVVVAAAQAASVQHWLEQVQPLRPTPVVAITAAAAGPILRPYFDSGQLAGLVSGFDGAYSYQRLQARFATPAETPRLQRQVVLQNWGHLALLGVIALGNLAALLARENQS